MSKKILTPDGREAIKVIDGKLPGRSPIEFINGRPNWKTHVFHYSEISTYLTCPWQFYLSKLKGFCAEDSNAASFRGRAVHHAIAQVKRKDVWDSPIEVLRDAWALEGASADATLLPASEVDKLPKELVKAEEIMTNWAEREVINKSRIMYTEIPFHMEMKGIKFGGTIDEIREGDNGIQLIDYKTNQAAPDRVFLMNNFQFMIYGLAMKYGVFEPYGGTINLGKLPDEAVWYHLNYLTKYKKKQKQNDGSYKYKGDYKGDPWIDVPWNTYKEREFFHSIRRAVGGIKGNSFYKRALPTGSCVGFCNVTRACCGDPDAPRYEDKAEIDDDFFDELIG